MMAAPAVPPALSFDRQTLPEVHPAGVAREEPFALKCVRFKVGTLFPF